MKRDFVTPILVLSLICLFVSGALAFANDVTRDIIETAAVERAEAAMAEIIPAASKFAPIDLDGLPQTVAEAYSADGGYIFIVKSYGYGGELRVMCGITPDGKIIGSAVLSHNETRGLGTVVFDRADSYEGKDRNLGGVDAVAGSTITSNAYRNAIEDAFEAFDIVKGGAAG